MDSTHLTIGTLDRVAMCPSLDVLLDVTRAVALVAGPHLLLFCVVDEHAHQVVDFARAAAGPLARGVAYAVGRRVAVELEPTRFRPVQGRQHMTTLVGYVLDQPRKHGLAHAGHPALWPGSCFVDLVGARLLEGFEPRRLAAALPRLGRDDLYAAVGLRPVEPLDDATLGAEGPGRIGDAAAAALGLPVLDGSAAPVLRARRAAGRLCRDLGFSDAQVAFGLRCPRSTASRLTRTAGPDRALDRAIRLQLALRRAVLERVDAPFQRA